MNVRVSIIVPMYNAENQIKRTLASLLKQTYKNIEILLIDDGSTDRSKDIIKNAFQDKRLTYVYQENSGAPAARNSGLKRAQGDYILFFDADDEMNVQGIEELVETAEANASDIVIGNFTKIDDDGYLLEEDTLTYLLDLLKKETDAEERLRLIAYMDPLPGNKLFKTSFLLENQLEFSELNIAQDVNFFLKAIGYYPKVSFAPGRVFSYRIHEGTISRHYTEKVLDIIPCFEDIETHHFDFYSSFPKVMETNKFNHYAYQLYKLPFFTDKSERKRAHKKLKTAFNQIKLDLIEPHFITVNQAKVRAALTFGPLYTSDLFSKYFKVSQK